MTTKPAPNVLKAMSFGHQQESAACQRVGIMQGSEKTTPCGAFAFERQG